MKTNTLLKVIIAAVAAAATALPAASASASGRPPGLRGRAGTGTTFPVTVPSEGSRVVVPARPARILSLSPSATQMLYAVGAGRQVVGVDKYSTYPPGAPRTKFTGSETNAEGYLPLRPDLVVMAFPSGTVVHQLQLLHIPAVVLPPAANLSQVDQQMEELGLATGHAAQARRSVASLSADLSRQAKYAGGAGRGKSYFIELDPTYYTATSRTFIGAELSLFGLHNVADAAGHGSTYPQVSAEFVLRADPYYVFLADTVCCAVTPASFGHRPGFSVLSAVRAHRVIGVNDSIASEWGPHTVEGFVGLVARLLHK